MMRGAREPERVSATHEAWRCAVLFSVIVICLAARAQESPAPQIYAYRAVSAFNLYLYQGMMSIPAAIAVDPKHGEVWVADTGKDLLSVFAANGISLFAFHSDDTIRQPQRMVVSPSGELLVIEGKRDQIRRFSYRGEYRGVMTLEGFDSAPSIGALAFDAAGNLYIAENHSGQVFVYGDSGRLRFQFGSRGMGEGQFLSISGIAIAPDGSIFVADQQGIPVQAFDGQGNYLTSWGRHEMGRQNFGLPSGIAVNSKGYVIVSDELRHDVKTFDARGNVIQMFGGQGPGLGAFSFPTNVAVDAEDRLYVAERGNKRVQIFELVAVTPAPAVTPSPSSTPDR